jgi:hypothetical protein
MYRLKWSVVGALATAVLVFAAVGIASVGGWPSDRGEQRKVAVVERAHVFQRAANMIPTPFTKNFPLRRTLAEMTKREDLLNHPWFVYMLGENGNVIGYYVARTVPINGCDFLSSTEDIWQGDGVSQKMTAPSLDGVYYGGGGAMGGCDVWVWLDAATGAEIKVKGVNFYVADQPLRVLAKPIRVSNR